MKFLDFLKKFLIFLLLCGAIFATAREYAPQSSGFENNRDEILQNRRKIEADAKELQERMSSDTSARDRGSCSQNSAKGQKMEDIRKQNERTQQELRERERKLQSGQKRR